MLTTNMSAHPCSQPLSKVVMRCQLLRESEKNEKAYIVLQRESVEVDITSGLMKSSLRNIFDYKHRDWCKSNKSEAARYIFLIDVRTRGRTRSTTIISRIVAEFKPE